MPLVPRSTIDIWYRRDSWVYRQFKFLFDNPLWHARVPSGFSLCPYFWLALFALLVLRPLVYGFIGLRWALTLKGLPSKYRWGALPRGVAWLIEWTDKPLLWLMSRMGDSAAGSSVKS